MERFSFSFAWPVKSARREAARPELEFASGPKEIRFLYTATDSA
jgi:hypothetical protein